MARSSQTIEAHGATFEVVGDHVRYPNGSYHTMDEFRSDMADLDRDYKIDATASAVREGHDRAGNFSGIFAPTPVGKFKWLNKLKFWGKGGSQLPNISGFTAHAADQAVTRGFGTSSMAKILREGTSVMKQGRYGMTEHFVLGRNTVVVSRAGRNNGNVITVFSDLPGTRKGLGRGNFVPFE